MTIDIKNLQEGCHLLEQELYDAAVSNDEIDYKVSKSDIGKWFYFDKDYECFMSAEDYSGLRNSAINTGDTSLVATYEERIDELCELRVESKILSTPDVGMYECAFYQVTLKDFEDLNASDMLEEDEDLGIYVYFDGDLLCKEFVWESWRQDARDENNYAEEVEFLLIEIMLSRLNSKNYLVITQEQIDEQNANYDSSYLSGASSSDWVYDDGEVLVSQACVYDWASKSKSEDEINYWSVFNDLQEFNMMDYRRNG